jgi:hypothetical protein
VKNKKDTLKTVSLIVPTNDKVLGMLRQLLQYGVYGSTVEQVAARLIDRSLLEFIQTPIGRQ